MIKNIVCKEEGLSAIGLIVSVCIIGILAAGITTATYDTNRTLADQTGPISAEALVENSDLTTPVPGLENIESQIDLPALQSETDKSASQIELKIIQTAVDIMMIRQGIHTINPAVKTNDMTVFPTIHPLYPRYLRSPKSQFYYSCDSTGQVYLEQ